MDDQRTDWAGQETLWTNRQLRFYSRLNPTQAALAVFLISIPAWCVLAIQVYSHGIVSWDWPMSIGPIRVFMYCIPGEHKCVATIPGLTWILEWLFLPTHLGIAYLLLFIASMFVAFRSTFARTWQRRSLWLLPVGAVAVIGGLSALEKLGL